MTQIRAIYWLGTFGSRSRGTGGKQKKSIPGKSFFTNQALNEFNALVIHVSLPWSKKSSTEEGPHLTRISGLGKNSVT